jgi:hypothetical protein
LQEFLELDDVLETHFLHALHLPLQVVEKMLVFAHHLFLVDHLQRPPRTTRALLHQENVTEGALAQLSLADVFSLEDAVD